MVQLRLDNMIENPLPEYFEMLVEAAFTGLLVNTSEEHKDKIAIATTA
jgi:hypothetical protein